MYMFVFNFCCRDDCHSASGNDFDSAVDRDISSKDHEATLTILDGPSLSVCTEGYMFQSNQSVHPKPAAPLDQQ